MTIVACLKWVDGRPDVDPLSGAVRTDDRTSGASDADRAALEWALRLGAARGEEVLAVTAGPPGSEAMLRDAMAVGAARAVRVDLDRHATSQEVAAAIARTVGPVGALLCGNWSADRGSGSVPAFLAAHLGVAQALGLVTMEVGTGPLLAERRLDGGRRERLRIPMPAVLSVEGGSARLRRASVAGLLGARDATIEVVAGAGALHATPTTTTAFRPRSQVLPAPSPTLDARDRILALTGALETRTPPETVVLEPAAAADRLLAQLRTWGYLDTTA